MRHRKQHSTKAITTPIGILYPKHGWTQDLETGDITDTY